MESTFPLSLRSRIHTWQQLPSELHETGRRHTQTRSCGPSARARPPDYSQGVHWEAEGYLVDRAVELGLPIIFLPSQIDLGSEPVKTFVRAVSSAPEPQGHCWSPTRTQSHRETGSPSLCLRSPATAHEEVNLAFKMLHQTYY